MSWPGPNCKSRNLRRATLTIFIAVLFVFLRLTLAALSRIVSGFAVLTLSLFPGAWLLSLLAPLLTTLLPLFFHIVCHEMLLMSAVHPRS